MQPFIVLINTLWWMLPVYVVHPAAVLTGGGMPIDFRKNFLDGKRLLGEGKTWCGLVGSTCAGLMIGMIQNTLAVIFPNEYFPVFANELGYAILIIFLLSFLSIWGDSIGSFIKRRRGIDRGEKAFLLDQLSFLVFTWLMLIIIVPSWFFEHFGNWISLITVFVLTPVLHRVVNIIGYKMGKKKVPW